MPMVVSSVPVAGHFDGIPGFLSSSRGILGQELKQMNEHILSFSSFTPPSPPFDAVACG